MFHNDNSRYLKYIHNDELYIVYTQLRTILLLILEIGINLQKFTDFRCYNIKFQEVTSEMIKDLRGRWELLAEFSGHVIDDALMAHLEKHHCTCNTES